MGEEDSVEVDRWGMFGITRTLFDFAFKYAQYFCICA